ncbi:uncharacterized protein EI97DRAFT_434768 [Westerdykella ornata]|uniref:Uncharacterized protein n=1 Tax=Westerdykella ornata TaxID=318751 RepID=A0A6A6JHX8_WESOR|nr:uncharacterized protein EI97DRAFT_434768 [Westerdykella ornata]KAF2274859.1 hypothetical protein EI97DRAFT_434768 [Westerdykella ornata]
MNRMDSGFSMTVTDQQHLKTTIKRGEEEEEEDNHNRPTPDAISSPPTRSNGKNPQEPQQEPPIPPSTPDQLLSSNFPLITSKHIEPTSRSPKSTPTTPRRAHKPSHSISSRSHSHSHAHSKSKSKSLPSSSSGDVRSRPSSHRTSCTLVDPSRPTRQHRINSLSAQSASQDVDDVLALHFRSYALFHPPPPQTMTQTEAQRASPLFYEELCVGGTCGRQEGPKSLDENHHTSSRMEKIPPPTTTHFLLPSTRRKQYERIRRAHSGLRGLLRRVVPCAMGPAPVAFYEGGRESEAGSVRRFRMDVDEEEEGEEEEEGFDFEKGSKGGVQERGSLERKEKDMGTREEERVRRKGSRWGRLSR